MSADPQAIKDERERQRSFEEQMELLNGAQARAEPHHSARRDLVEEIKKSPLDEPSGEVLKNLLSPDFIFANYRTQEVEELKHMLRLKKKKFFDMHPSRESLATGTDRAYINDDASDRLEPLTDAQEIYVEDFFDGVYARITRGEEMAQQEIIQTSISENRLQRDSDDGGGGGGLISRIRRS